jgi:hypothetical protein
VIVIVIVTVIVIVIGIVIVIDGVDEIVARNCRAMLPSRLGRRV